MPLELVTSGSKKNFLRAMLIGPGCTFVLYTRRREFDPGVGGDLEDDYKRMSNYE